MVLVCFSLCGCVVVSYSVLVVNSVIYMMIIYGNYVYGLVVCLMIWFISSVIISVVLFSGSSPWWTSLKCLVMVK